MKGIYCLYYFIFKEACWNYAHLHAGVHSLPFELFKVILKLKLSISKIQPKLTQNQLRKQSVINNTHT